MQANEIIHNIYDDALANWHALIEKLCEIFMWLGLPKMFPIQDFRRNMACQNQKCGFIVIPKQWTKTFFLS